MTALGMELVFGMAWYYVFAGTSSAIADTMPDGSGRVLVPPAGAVSRLEGLAP